MADGVVGARGGGPTGVGLGKGLRAGEEVSPGAVGVEWAGEVGGEEGRPGQGPEVGSAGGGEDVRQGESVVSAGTREHGAADCTA